ncbi:Solute carrier family 22 member 11 [Chionoecetes opilio]|uniref:Solute carrier family 22 member 11 n=1 Tax=Chionoecetes opilio TaxID=41210 RepID=A0A8J4YQG5_CHIOP|nr:Solute carrier family 22 member 11 [Chionoecetes opilio]
MIDAGQYLGLFVFIMETCATKYRAAAGTLFGIPRSLGYMAVPGLAYLVRTWRLLQVAYAIPSLLGIFLFVWLPESLGGIIVKGSPEALEVMTQLAKVNVKDIAAGPPSLGRYDGHWTKRMKPCGDLSAVRAVSHVAVRGPLTLLLPETQHLDLSEPPLLNHQSNGGRGEEKCLNKKNSVSQKETTKGL